MTKAREVKEIRDSDGRLLADCEYLDGKPDGRERIWSKAGTLVLEVHDHGPPTGKSGN
jgi:hypothetical protein